MQSILFSSFFFFHVHEMNPLIPVQMYFVPQA